MLADGPPSSIKRAAALRIKYRAPFDPHRRLSPPPDPNHKLTVLSPKLVAQHKLNRGGVAINGNRCDELLRQVWGHYDAEEANHGAVCVEEQPNSSVIRDYNKEKTAGDPALAGVSDQAIPFGSLGASHINQVLRNILFGASSELVPEARDDAGRLSLERVALHDPAMVEACVTGLKGPVPRGRDRRARWPPVHCGCPE